jgi:hypothetical protein
MIQFFLDEKHVQNTHTQKQKPQDPHPYGYDPANLTKRSIFWLEEEKQHETDKASTNNQTRRDECPPEL